MRLGLLGGSFNPIHTAHLRMAAAAREALRLDRVIFIPARMPPHKRSGDLAPESDRLEMARLAVAAEPACEVSDIEMRRPGPSYTIDTIEALRRASAPGDELFFLIGADTLLELPMWRQIGRLAALCKFTPMARPGVPPPDGGALADAVGREEAQAILARAVPLPPLDISSSDIRRRVAEGRPIGGLTPPAVEDYIRRRGLYRRLNPAAPAPPPPCCGGASPPSSGPRRPEPA